MRFFIFLPFTGVFVDDDPNHSYQFLPLKKVYTYVFISRVYNNRVPYIVFCFVTFLRFSARSESYIHFILGCMHSGRVIHEFSPSKL